MPAKKYRKTCALSENLKEPRGLLAKTEAIRLAFVLTELDMAITFCKVAESTDDSARKQRNIDNAWKGYEGARRFSQGAGYNPRNHLELKEKLKVFENWLERLTPPTDSDVGPD